MKLVLEMEWEVGEVDLRTDPLVAAIQRLGSPLYRFQLDQGPLDTPGWAAHLIGKGHATIPTATARWVDTPEPAVFEPSSFLAYPEGTDAS